MSFIDKDTLYLFCDASILNLKGSEIYIGCPGVISAEIQQDRLELNYIKSKLLFDTTNNNSEITAILLGVYEAIKNKDKYKKIKLLSDSMICISSLRLWIFSWINNIRN